jgi:hypothetical protein
LDASSATEEAPARSALHLLTENDERVDLRSSQLRDPAAGRTVATIDWFGP